MNRSISLSWSISSSIFSFNNLAFSDFKIWCLLDLPNQMEAMYGEATNITVFLGFFSFLVDLTESTVPF